MRRADLFVYLALVVGWLLVAAWAWRIGRKADRLEARLTERGEGGSSVGDRA